MFFVIFCMLREGMRAELYFGTKKSNWISANVVFRLAILYNY